MILKISTYCTKHWVFRICYKKTKQKYYHFRSTKRNNKSFKFIKGEKIMSKLKIIKHGKSKYNENFKDEVCPECEDDNIENDLVAKNKSKEHKIKSKELLLHYKCNNCSCEWQYNKED